MSMWMLISMSWIHCCVRKGLPVHRRRGGRVWIPPRRPRNRRLALVESSARKWNCTASRICLLRSVQSYAISFYLFSFSFWISFVWRLVWVEACGPAFVAAAVAVAVRKHLHSRSHSRSHRHSPFLLEYRPNHNHLLEVRQWSQWVLWEV